MSLLTALLMLQPPLVALWKLRSLVALSLPNALSYAIIKVCLQQRGSNRCRLALVWGVERIFGAAGIPGLA